MSSGGGMWGNRPASSLPGVLDYLFHTNVIENTKRLRVRQAWNGYSDGGRGILTAMMPKLGETMF